MKTSLVVGLIIFVHCIAVGVVLLTPGCGTTTAPPRESVVSEPVESIEMPPGLNEKRTVKPSLTERIGKKEPVKSWPGKTSTYVVAKGDYLSEIAKRFDVSVKQLMALNGLKDPNLIRAGHTLVIPGDIDVTAMKSGKSEASLSSGRKQGHVAAGGKYEVKKGDTLSEIAVANGTTVSAIKKANSLSSNVIKIGQKLIVPGRADKPKESAMVDNPGNDKKKRFARPVDLSKPEEKPKPVEIEEPEPVEETPVSVATRPHIVEKGEDLKTIAMLWGVTVEEITSLNDVDGASVKPGDRLLIPIPQY